MSSENNDPFGLGCIQETDLLRQTPQTHNNEQPVVVSNFAAIPESLLACINESALQPFLTSPSQSLTPCAKLNAKEHYDRAIMQCVCNPKFVDKIDDAEEFANKFASLKESERIKIVRSMFLAVTSAADDHNELCEWMPSHAAKQKIKRRRTDTGGNKYTVYCLVGKRVCRHVFSAIVQLHPVTINKHANEVSSNRIVGPYKTFRSEGQNGRRSLQTIVALGFLRRYGDLHALACPTGRGSSDEQAVQWLPCDATKKLVYDAYVANWSEIMGFAFSSSFGSPIRPDKPLGKDAFGKVWKQYISTLRILKTGSDFCDLCNQLKNTAKNLQDPDAKEAVIQARERHRQEALVEFRRYRSRQAEAEQNPSGEFIHLVFDFAEKILLPSLLRQPGQLHFVTGLKFDFFGVACSNVNRTYIFGLPEGHWPMNKTCKEVASMLHHTISLQRQPGSVCASISNLVLHADNCAGQNKNQFMIYYLAWRVCVGLETEIELNFLVAGHTKNQCDGAFGHVKRALKQADVLCPKDMMGVIEGSTTTNHGIYSVDVLWFDWKKFLTGLFKVPTSFRISKHHVFTFRSTEPGIMKVKELSSTADFMEYRLFKRGVTETSVRLQTTEALNNPGLVLSPTPLELVPSPQEHTRRGYLEKNVCQRYYDGNERFIDEYFGNGKDN